MNKTLIHNRKFNLKKSITNTISSATTRVSLHYTSLYLILRVPVRCVYISGRLGLDTKIHMKNKF